jgi:signal transduction histidine kinase
VTVATSSIHRSSMRLPVVRAGGNPLRDFAGQDRKLQAIVDLAEALSLVTRLSDLQDYIVERVPDLLDAERASLFLMTDDGERLTCKTGPGDDAERITLTTGEGIAGWVATENRPVNVKDAYQDPRFDQRWDQCTGFTTRSLLCQPVLYRDRAHADHAEVIGVIQVLNKRGEGYFSVADGELLAAIMGIAAIALMNARIHAELVHRNIELGEARRDLQAKIQEIDLLYAMERDVSEATSTDGLIALLLQRVDQALPAAVAEIALPTASGGMVVHRVSGRRRALTLHHFERPVGICGRVLAGGGRIDPCDMDDEATRRLALDEGLEREPRTGACLPLEADGRVRGAIGLFDRDASGSCFDEHDTKLLTLISGQVSRALARLREREERAREERLGALGSALAGILHDFKTPMTIAQAYVEMMRDSDDPERRAALAERVFEKLGRMTEMSGEVLAFARGEQQLFLQSVHFNDFADEVGAVLDEVFSGSEIRTEVDARFRGKGRIDRAKALRVVQNMARNARQAIEQAPSRPEEPLFVVRIERADGPAAAEGEAGSGPVVVLTFADNGPGIPAGFRHRLFETFATRGKSDGTGLGLAMAREVAEAHGGSVTHRETPGGGATFELRLPLAPRAASGIVQPQRAAPEQRDESAAKS